MTDLIDHTVDRAAAAALRLARTGHLTAARETMRRLAIQHDREGLYLAALTWIDGLLETTDAAEVRPDDSPEQAWAADLIAARAAWDRAAYERLLAVPTGPAQVRDHVMGLLTLVASQP